MKMEDYTKILCLTFSRYHLPPPTQDKPVFMSLGFRAIIHETGSDFLITVTEKEQLPLQST